MATYGVQYFMGNVPLGYQEGASPSIRFPLTVDISDVTASQIKAYTVDGGTLYLAPFPDALTRNALITISLADAQGRQWRLLPFGSGYMTQARMDDGKSWALVVISSDDASPSNFRTLQADTPLTVVETGVAGYRALLTMSPDDFSGTPQVRSFFGGLAASGAVSGGFALLIAGGESAPPDAPSITSPTEAQHVSSLTPTITVSAVSGATGYDFDVATDSGFSSIVSQVTDDADGSWVTGTLTNGVLYYVRARARNAAGTSDWSSTVTFRTVVFLFNEEFNSWPNATDWTITDTGGNLSSSSGELVYTNQVGALNPTIVSVATHARAAGKIFAFKDANAGTGRVQMALRQGGTYFLQMEVHSLGSLTDQAGSALTGILKTADSTQYDVVVVLRATGYEVYINVSGTWKLRFIGTLGTQTPITIEYLSVANSGVLRKLGGIKVAALGDAYWTTLANRRTLNVASPTNDTDYTGDASGLLDFAWTAPGSLSGDNGIEFRRQDANNKYYAYFDNAGAFKVDRIVSGTPTNVVSVASVISAGQTRTIRCITDGSTLDFYTGASGVWTKRGSTVSSATFASETGVRTNAATGTLGALTSNPTTEARYAELDPFLA